MKLNLDATLEIVNIFTNSKNMPYINGEHIFNKNIFRKLKKKDMWNWNG